MTKLMEQATTSLSQREAFEKVAAFENIDLWDPGVIESTKRGDEETGVGTAFDLQLSYGGRKLEMTYTITEWEPNNKVVLEGTGGVVYAIDTISFEPFGDGTVVTYEADLRLTGFARLFQPFMKSRFDALGKAAGDGLRSWLKELDRQRS